MKPPASLIHTAVKCLFLLATPLLAADAPPAEPPPEAPATDASTGEDLTTREEPADNAALDAAIAEVQNRVGMAAPMEIETVAGVDPIVEAAEQGLIVEASLEEVEAALAAAAATPEIEDDQQAIDLKHRGSYRFYFDETTAEPPPLEEPGTAPNANP